MDFKVAGTEKGITAVQVDVKIPGLTYEIIEETLKKAKKGRLIILEKMKEAISRPRESISKYAPQIISMPIKRDKIGELIGPGGKNIRKIMEETNSEIFIDDEKGIVYITSPDGESADRAILMVKESIEDVEVGKVYEVEVRRVLDRGAIVGFLRFPRQTAFLHISEIDDRRIDDIRKELREGQRLTVKVIRIDETENKVFVSVKALKK
jgi:polyribonucleotide nucleotidyltransferase